MATDLYKKIDELDFSQMTQDINDYMKDNNFNIAVNSTYIQEQYKKLLENQDFVTEAKVNTFILFVHDF